ncbi:hypothetical protein [Streptomyces sp. N35]|uniref:hypothetical protein n=1 Tax=Streptomyces sp. N35 TaxID=2795730 RepID=UPI001F2B22C7|nr:hypothetical protein [Streptomyces sp. N35]
MSLYGASDASAEALTRTPKAYSQVIKGLTAIRETALNTEIALIVTKHNAHEITAMRTIAAELADTVTEHANISPTYDGQPDPLASQAPEFLDRPSAFTGCPAGHTFLHADPFGLATMCKVGRENPSIFWTPASKDSRTCRTSPMPRCFAPEAVQVANSPAPAGSAGRSPRPTRKRRHR